MCSPAIAPDSRMAPSPDSPSPHSIDAKSTRSPGVWTCVWRLSETGLPGIPVIIEIGSTVIIIAGDAV